MKRHLPTGLEIDSGSQSGTVQQGWDIVRFSAAGALILAAASWFFLLAAEDGGLLEYFSTANFAHIKRFGARLLGQGSATPAFLMSESWREALTLTLETLQMSVMAAGLAGLAMLLTVIPAARTAADGKLTLRRTWYGWLSFRVIRLLYVFSRAVPELIWAMLVIFIFKPGILPGAIALGLHNFGILGKLCAEVIEDLELRPVRSLRASGAGTGQMLLYGVLPAVAPKFVTYLLYRWEVILRTTIVVGFVGAGGLGRQFKLSMSWFQYTEITLLLFCYLFLVGAVDLLSGLLRRLAQ